LVRIWALGPYLFRSYCGTKDHTLIFPQEIGGTIHGISFVPENEERQEEDSPVHKEASCWDAVVYGGKQLAVCRVVMGLGNTEQNDMPKIHRYNLLHSKNDTSSNNNVNKQLSHLTTSDWIWDAKILVNYDGYSQEAKDEEDDHDDVNTKDTNRNSWEFLALGLGRHTVEIWGVSRQVQKARILEAEDSDFLNITYLRRIPGSVPCLVMSMCLWQRDNRLWIAAGTAFQTIQVWSTTLGGDTVSDVTEQVNEACLTGHKGVIHSVQWSRDGQHIISTSDDRSVRLWTREGEDLTIQHQAWREVWVAWGHTARVWSASFLSRTVVVSVAEDATTRLWSMETGEPLSCIRHSTGLWSMEILNNLVMVGAADGTATLYNLFHKLPGKQLEIIDSIPIPDAHSTIDENPTIDESTPEEGVATPADNKVAKKAKKKPPKNVHVIVGMQWLNSNEILLATRSGALMTLNVPSRTWHSHDPWWTPELGGHGISPLDGCCMAYCDGTVAIGTTRGDIVIFRLEHDQTGVRPFHILSGVTFKSVNRLKWIPEHGMLISFHVRSVAIWKFSESGVDYIETRNEPNVTLDVETKGSPKSCVYDHGQNQVIVGDMRGSILLFQLPTAISTHEVTTSVKASSVLSYIHKREHVNDISLRNNTLRSVGNDGCICTSYRRGTSLQTGFSVPVTAMTGLSEIWTTPSKFDQIIVSGFFGNIFRIMDATTGMEVFEMNTGGRQRLHNLYIPAGETPESGLKHMAVCMNEKVGTNSIMIHRELPSQDHRTIGDSKRMSEGLRLHGETIFDVCFMSLGENSPVSFMITTSEDCGTKIVTCRKDDFIDVMPLTPQESCVRAVCTSQFDDMSSLIVVGGGKLTIQFFLIKSATAGFSQVTCLSDTEVFFLRQGFTRQKASIDQRINVVRATPLHELGTEREHLVVGGDSAGQCFLDIVSENVSTRPSTGVVVEVSQRPVLCMALLPILGRILVAMGNTAGEVILYDLPGSPLNLRQLLPTLPTAWKPVAVFQAHQMGTNTMSMSAETLDGKNAEVTIFTGGDDQAISVCKFPLHLSEAGSLCPGPFSVVTESNASFSAIKGIVDVPSSSKGCRYILSAGYTQRHVVWKWKNEKLEAVRSLPVDIGDVNALTACKGTRGDFLVAVAGMGVELFNMSSH